jgi:hypothetical protein
MSTYLLNMDFLGPQPTMYYNGRSKHATHVGSVLSIIALALLTSYLLYLVTLLFQRSNFAITLMEQNNINSSYIDWSNEDFGMAVLDRFGQPFEHPERLFNVLGVYWTQVKANTTNNKGEEMLTMKYYPIELESCNVSSFANQDLWENDGPISDSFCVKRGQYIDSKKIFGYLGYTGFTYWVQRCRNSTSKTDCYEDSVIDQLLDNSVIMFKFTDYYVDYNKLGNPLIPFINSQLKIISASVYKRIFFNFRNIEFSDDTSYIYSSNPNKYSTYSLAEVTETTDIRHLSTTTIPWSFFTLSINGFSLKQTIFRRYYKIQDLLSDFGGLLEMIIVIGYWINYLINRKLYDLHIINNNINSYASFDESLSNSSNHQPLEVSRSHSLHGITKPPICIEIKRKASLDKASRIKLSYVALILPKFCYSKRNKVGYVLGRMSKVMKTLTQQLDINNIIKKLNIVDKLTYIYFGENKEYIEKFPNPYMSDYRDSNQVIVNEREIFQFQEVCVRNLKTLTSKLY